MKTVYLTIGVIGSGKSTWALQKVQETDQKICIINKDLIREMIFGEYKYDPDKEDLVRKIAWASVQQAIEHGYDVIIDETNITRKKRHQWIDYLRLHFGNNINIIFVLCSESKRNLEFRKNDLRGIAEGTWKNLIEFMIKDFQPVASEGQNSTIEYKIPEKLMTDANGKILFKERKRTKIGLVIENLRNMF